MVVGLRTSARDVALYPREEKVDLWKEENEESDKSVEDDDQHLGAGLVDGSQRGRGVVGWDEGKPQYAQRVYGEVNELGLVEVLWDFSCTEGEVESEQEKKGVVSQHDRESNVRGVATFQLSAHFVEDVCDARSLHDKPHCCYENLNCNQKSREKELTLRIYERRRGRRPRWSIEDAMDSIGLH